MVSKWRIMSYWYDRIQLKFLTFSIGLKGQGKIGQLIQQERPFCLVCRKEMRSKRLTHKRMKITWSEDGEPIWTPDFKTVWNTVVGLQIHHIVPKSLGGVDTVDNLFLLCRSCHIEAPSSTSRELFLKWVDDHEIWFQKKERAFMHQMKAIVPESEQEDFVNYWCDNNKLMMQGWKHSGGDRIDTVFGLHGYSEATMVASLYIEWRKHIGRPLPIPNHMGTTRSEDKRKKIEKKEDK